MEHSLLLLFEMFHCFKHPQTACNSMKQQEYQKVSEHALGACKILGVHLLSC